jgi:hypothetical protein
MQERGKNKSKSNGKGQGKGKGKGKAKGGGNHVRDGSPSKNGGGQGSQQNHNYNHPQPHQQQNERQHQNHQNHRPNTQQSGSGSGQRQGRGSGNHAGQKRRATETATNGPTENGGHAPKRRKSERQAHLLRSPPPNSDSNLGSGAAAQPHPDFWHPDGSVIIEVEKTKFRLHQSTLQKHSAYFAAMFHQGENLKGGGGGNRRRYLEVEVDERSPNGGHLPVYRVPETTADDFASLLSLIEEPMKYADEAPPMPILAGVLRAARALSFDAQYKWAERIFERMWPATLDTLTTDAIPHAAVALALARTCGLRGVQKRASYELLRMPTFGQTIFAAPADEEDSRADLLRLLHAREQLGLAWAEAAGKAPTDFICPRTQIPERGGGGSSSSSSSGSCAAANVDRVHARWAELVHTTGLYVQMMVDPLMGLQDLVEIAWKEEGFCKRCVAARTNEWDGLRRKLWDDLDVWLELSAD